MQINSNSFQNAIWSTVDQNSKSSSAGSTFGSMLDIAATQSTAAAQNSPGVVVNLSSAATSGGSSGSATSGGGSANDAIDALIRLGASSRANGVNLNGDYRQVLFQLAANGSGEVTETQLEQAVVAGGGTTADGQALYSSLAESSGVSGNAPLQESNFEQGMAASSTEGSFTDVMEQLLDPNHDGKVTTQEFQSLLNTLEAQGTPLSNAATAWEDANGGTSGAA